MAADDFTLPTIGQANSAEDGRIRTGLSDIQTFVTNTLEEGGFNGAGAGTVRRGVTSIATEETTTATTYAITNLATQDKVASVVLPTDGLIVVAYRAFWKLTGASNSGAASIFLGSDQLKGQTVDSAPTVNEASLAASGDNYGLLRCGGSNLTAAPSATSDVSLVTTGLVTTTAPVFIEAAAGTYTVSVQYKCNATNGGTLSVKERKLHVWTMGF